MNDNIILKKYVDEEATAIKLIQGFWLAHNDYVEPEEEAKENLQDWTTEGHVIYFIEKDGETIGFVHMGSRGVEIDWIEDLFIKPEYQGNGYGSVVLKLIEQEVAKYSESIYLEVAARNLSALKLYRKNGYDCLNTITIRKDFQPENYDVIRKEELLGYEFEVKKDIE